MSALPRDPGPLWRRLPDGERLHAQHGPIDLIVSIDGGRGVRERGERAARTAFASVLTTLVAELDTLRRVVDGGASPLRGAVARRMHDAVVPYRAHVVTPMAAVAGAVADHVLSAIVTAASPARAYVNNGGDVALHVAAGERLRVGVCGDPRSGRLGADVDVAGGAGIGGVATSGWRGRSQSLGIADAVTVLAPTAAAADAAATVVANAVDLPGSDRVRRLPARALVPDSDLGARLVTVDVAPLTADERARALAPGVALARDLLARGLVVGVRLELQWRAIVVGAVPLADARAA